MDYWTAKTALVTGAASGIGRAVAGALTARGAFVVATDVDVVAVADVARTSECARAQGLDIRDAEAFRRAVIDLVAEKGRLDFLFNNAGVGVVGETYELAKEHWDYCLGVNVGGTTNGILAAYPQMVKQRSGHIVNVASLAGLGPAPFGVPYAASKHAIVGLSVSLRAEAADLGVRVSVVCPAAIETPLLDKDNPAHLPPVAWQPNMRRYLGQLVGPPYPVASCAEDALRAVARNEAIIVIPSRGRIAWRLGRLFPGLVEKRVRKAVRAERRHRMDRT